MINITLSPHTCIWNNSTKNKSSLLLHEYNIDGHGSFSNTFQVKKHLAASSQPASDDDDDDDDVPLVGGVIYICQLSLDHIDLYISAALDCSVKQHPLLGDSMTFISCFKVPDGLSPGIALPTYTVWHVLLFVLVTAWSWVKLRILIAMHAFSSSGIFSNFWKHISGQRGSDDQSLIFFMETCNFLFITKRVKLIRELCMQLISFWEAVFRLGFRKKCILGSSASKFWGAHPLYVCSTKNLCVYVHDLWINVNTAGKHTLCKYMYMYTF